MTLQPVTAESERVQRLMAEAEYARQAGDIQTLMAMMIRELARFNDHQAKLYPEPATYAIFPNQGGFWPIAAGTTTVDFRRGQVVAPNGTFPISTDIQFMKNVQSMYIVVDNVISFTPFPGVGTAQLYPYTPLKVNGRNIERITIAAGYNFGLFFALGNGQMAPDPQWLVNVQTRYSNTTLRKGSPANVADSWTGTPFVPLFGSNTLVQATFGNQFLTPVGCGQKEFLIRNLSAQTIEFRVRGAGTDAVAIALNAVTTTQDLILDPDIHVAGTPTANFVSVPANSPAVLETSIQYGECVLEARITAAVAVSTPAQYVVEFSGQSFAVR